MAFPIELIINASYFQEALHNIDSDSVTLQYLEEGKPLVVRPNPEASYFNLVMPMHK